MLYRRSGGDFGVIQPRYKASAAVFRLKGRLEDAPSCVLSFDTRPAQTLEYE